jgi:hypothetical protein
MAINFPSSPALNDIYTLGTRQWKWNGNGWALQPLTAGFTGSIGYTGSKGDIGYTGSKGDTGLGFNIAKTYTSVANLTADTSPSGINTGEFAIIENGSLTDAENSRLYLWNGSAYSFVSDLSGTIGFTGSFGYTGSKGDQGVIGYTGSKGDQGDIGYTGSKGDIGYTGSEGNLDITTSSTPPTSGVGEGDIWVDSATGVQYFYYNDGNSTQWVELSNQGVVGFTGSQGAQVDTVDSSNFSSAVTLLIKNSSGTTLKTIIGNAT